MTDETDALWFPTTNCWPNRYGHQPTYVILHGTASPNAFYAQDVARYFQNPSAESSSHYVIGRDGVIAQCVSEHDAAWGNGIILNGPEKKADPWWSPTLNPNLITISIEHVNPDPQNATPLTAVQQASSFRLIKDICQRWNIPLRPADQNGGITGHYSIDSLDRFNCPGNYPWDDLWRSLKENIMVDLSNPVVANYFVLWQGNWKCKRKTTDGIVAADNHTIRGEILSFYQSVGGVGLNGLTLLGLPIEDDHPVVDSSGKAYPQVLEQRFERGVVRYDPQHLVDDPPQSAGCYMAHVDELYSSPQKVQSLTQEVAQQNINNTQLQEQVQSLKTQLVQEQKQQPVEQTGSSGVDIAALVERVSQELLAQLRQKSGSPTITNGTEEQQIAQSESNTASAPGTT